MLSSWSTISKTSEHSSVAFIPASTWTGRIPGFALKTGSLGLGYYDDTDAQSFSGLHRPTRSAWLEPRHYDSNGVEPSCRSPSWLSPGKNADEQQRIVDVRPVADHAEIFSPASFDSLAAVALRRRELVTASDFFAFANTEKRNL